MPCVTCIMNDGPVISNPDVCLHHLRPYLNPHLNSAWENLSSGFPGLSHLCITPGRSPICPLNLRFPLLEWCAHISVSMSGGGQSVFPNCSPCYFIIYFYRLISFYFVCMSVFLACM